ncbi:MAG: DUF2789 domain-containing protein [Limnohabitans sp.]
MHNNFHDFTELFAQLGLPNEASDIRHFIRLHSPLNALIRLEDADFWSPAQAALLKEELLEDSDWAEVMDRLSVALRGATTALKL